ncbi:tagatose-bisphosphate aldolase subunit KbaY [Rubrobacter tropicus]|uniref:Tagatose-bisphosphate aldolase subunit KbaY n=1 Tax=Rubrobacter tropicus TaxID=2653851 RepID=A0A6G8Q833_9ACTN|nr:class II fructose-bisphosphate aldolase [Rubrobacter tropicus]QIN82592.1 tagatose-bisphosphate aldolase subunit KbaY [Rubrobacter tropicus]
MTRVTDGRELYARAYRGGFAMPAFNVCNLEMAQGVVEAAEAERAPVILQTYPGDIAHGRPALAPLLNALADDAGVPVMLHLDHGDGLEMAVACMKLGYSSVMFDGAELGLEENIARTGPIVEAAHEFGASVEGEVGLFGGDHGSVVLTDPDEAARFVSEAGADTLAVSVGSEHAQKSRLKLDLLRSVAESTGHPLVLHGGSGIHPDDVREAVTLGVVKINIGNALSQAVRQGARDALESGLDHYGMLAAIRDAVREVARAKIKLMGASGHA